MLVVKTPEGGKLVLQSYLGAPYRTVPLVAVGRSRVRRPKCALLSELVIGLSVLQARRLSDAHDLSRRLVPPGGVPQAVHC